MIEAISARLIAPRTGLFSCMPPVVDPVGIDSVSLRAPCGWTPDNHTVDNRELRVTRVMKDI